MTKVITIIFKDNEQMCTITQDNTEQAIKQACYFRAKNNKCNEIKHITIEEA